MADPKPPPAPSGTPSSLLAPPLIFSSTVSPFSTPISSLTHLVTVKLTTENYLF